MNSPNVIVAEPTDLYWKDSNLGPLNLGKPFFFGRPGRGVPKAGRVGGKHQGLGAAKSKGPFSRFLNSPQPELSASVYKSGGSQRGGGVQLF